MAWFRKKINLLRVKAYEEKIRYVITGVWNTLFGLTSFALLYYLLNPFFHYLLILFLSYVVSITNAYFSYKYLVFKTKGNSVREYFRFYLVYGASFLINVSLMAIMVEFMKVNPVVAQGGVLFLITIASYLGHKYYSFSPLPRQVND